MGDKIYKCNSGHIKAFPLTLRERPTLSQYTTNVDKTDDLIEFQWAPSVPWAVTQQSTTGSIIIQAAEATGSTSTIRFNTLSYSIKNVQLTQAQHSMWLIADPGTTNTGDLVILLEATSPRKGEPIYTIFVIPLLNTGSEATDPEYLKNTNRSGVGSSPGVNSCFPKKTGTVDPLFAHYVTCFDGYTNHAHTQDIDVFVSTVGVPVSSVTMTAITRGVTPGVIELPTTIQNRYYIPPTAGGSETGARQTAAMRAGNYSDVGGITSISPTQFPNIITTTQFSSSISNVGGVKLTRKDPTDAYQCVELDPNEVDANNNIHIDMKTGKIASSTLDDILAEREVMKQLVNPDANIDPKMRESRKYYEFVLSLIIILGTLGGLYLFVFSTNTENGRSFWEILLSSIIALTLLIAAGLGFLGGDDNIKQIGGWMALASGIAGFIFFLYFYIVNPSPTTTECGKTAIALANASGSTGTGTNAANLSQQASINAAKAAAAAAEKKKSVAESLKAFFAANTVQIAIVGAITGLLGFIIGHVV